MKTRMMVFAAIVVSAAFGGAAHATLQPSQKCGSAATATPVPGISVLAAPNTDNDSGTVRVCNDGETIGPGGQVPLPAKGALNVSGNASAQTATVYVDGDSDNVSPAGSCTTGFVGATADANGPVLYEAGSGDFSTAHPKSPDVFLEDLLANCAGVAAP